MWSAICTTGRSSGSCTRRSRSTSHSARTISTTAEALTNVTKHAGAQHAVVRAWAGDGVLHVEVRDDAAGGARSDGGGLVGLQDWLAALGGQLHVESPPGRGTRIAASLPLHDAAG